MGAYSSLLFINYVAAAKGQYFYAGEGWDKFKVTVYPRGRIVEFSTRENFCASPILIPGITILPGWFQGTIYLLGLFYLFLGISIISDVFMAAIEVITSQRRTFYRDDEMGNRVPVTVNVWNPTVANLSLMALGSSAPEILLNCIETIKGLAN